MRHALVSGPPNRKKPYNKHLISLVFSVRTVNYGSSFFPSIYRPRASRVGHKSKEKNSVRNLQYEPKTRLIRGIYFKVILSLYQALIVFSLIALPVTTTSPTVCLQKTTSGKCCSIPFKYKAVTYNSCTNADHNRPWCSLDSVYKGRWDNCREF